MVSIPQLGLGSVLLMALSACSESPPSTETGAPSQELSKLVSIRVAGFVEAAGIT